MFAPGTGVTVTLPTLAVCVCGAGETLNGVGRVSSTL
jgi:hypothetical protein